MEIEARIVRLELAETFVISRESTDFADVVHVALTHEGVTGYGEVPDGHYSVPIGKAEIVRAGSQLSIITYGTMVYVCEAAAKSLGLDAEIIDVRSLVPLDTDTICSSVRKTGRCLVAHEATRFGGFGAELSATIQEECFWDLEAPIERVAGWDTPYPHAFEWEYFPGQARVAIALKALMEAA